MESNTVCSGCNNRGCVTTTFTLSRLPQVLFLQLVRFQYDRQSGRRRKVRAAVRVDETLRVGTVSYDFAGAIIHRGADLEFGHYVTVAKCADDEYRCFNDAWRPRVVTWDDVKRQCEFDAYILVFQRTATNLAAVAAPSRPALPTQWGQEADVDDESVSEDESESESEDEAPPPRKRAKRAPKQRREAPEPAPRRSRRRTEPTDDAPDARPPKRRGETARRRPRTTRRGPPTADDDGLSDEEPEPKRPPKRRRAKASSGHGGEDDSDDGGESYKEGGDTTGDDSDLDSDDGYDGPELPPGRTKLWFRDTKGPYDDIERLLKDKEAWRRFRRHNSSLKDGFFTVFPEKWRPGDPLPDIMRDAWDEHGHPLEDDPKSLGYLARFAEICYHANVRMPLPGESFTIRTYCKWLHAWATTRSKRRRDQLTRAARRVMDLLETSGDAAKELAHRRPWSRACPMCLGKLCILFAERRANDPDLPRLSAFGITVFADGSVVNNNDRDAGLDRDHLELSRFFRARLCYFHNRHVVHQADERTVEGYTAFCARVHENARTYLDDTPPPSDGEGSSSGSD